MLDTHDPAAWTCRLCGETIYSAGVPSRCPACGAFADLLAPAWEEPGVLGRSMIIPPEWLPGGQRAIRQEVDTSELYSRIAVAATHPYLRTCFRLLSRIEGRHAALLAALFKVRRPPPELRPELAGTPDHDLLDMVEAREDATIGIYVEEGDRARGTEVEEVYRALIRIEEDHNSLAAILRRCAT